MSPNIGRTRPPTRKAIPDFWRQAHGCADPSRPRRAAASLSAVGPFERAADRRGGVLGDAADLGGIVDKPASANRRRTTSNSSSTSWASWSDGLEGRPPIGELVDGVFQPGDAHL
jgi:hypothetical protein